MFESIPLPHITESVSRRNVTFATDGVPEETEILVNPHASEALDSQVVSGVSEELAVVAGDAADRSFFVSVVFFAMAFDFHRVVNWKRVTSYLMKRII